MLIISSKQNKTKWKHHFHWLQIHLKLNISADKRVIGIFLKLKVKLDYNMVSKGELLINNAASGLQQ